MQDVALTRPDALAVCDGVQSLTYGALDARANALAHRLRALGVRPGVRVGLCHERSAVSIVGALATLKAGGAYVGLDPTYPDARLEYMLADAAVPVLLTQRSIAERLGSVAAAVIDLDVDPAPTDACREPCDDLAAADDVAYVIYTSGSTGEPKGVQVSHGNLVSLVDWHCEAFRVRPTDRASGLASPAFDASVWELWPYLTAGASLHIPESTTAAVPRALRDWLVAAGITISFVPTPLAEELLELQWPLEVPLRIMLTGGDLLHRRPAPGTPFELVNNYGVAEATVVSTSGTVAPSTGAAGVPSIGRPIAGTRLYVLDADGRPVPEGDAGELHIGGPGVAIGYLNRADLTAERFRPDPFVPEPGARTYRTGDRVRVTPEGEVEFLGRLDNQVQVRGQRVELDEVEASLLAHPAVGRCVVVAREKEPGDVRLVAYVVASNPSNRDVSRHPELREHLSKRLPAFMVPSAFVDMEALPVTGNGKLDREALPAPAPESGLGAGRATTRGTPIEAAVTAILEELLELDGIGPDDNFFELGGHSLMGAQLVTRLEDLFDVEVTLLTVFDNPTAAGIAAAIERDTECAPRVSPYGVSPDGVSPDGVSR